MGKLNFRGYFILQFYPTRKMCRNLMHAMFYSIVINYRKLKAVNLIIRAALIAVTVCWNEFIHLGSFICTSVFRLHGAI